MNFRHVFFLAQPALLSKNIKIPSCHCQLEALRKHFEISVPSVNDHLTIVDIFLKIYENDPCIQTISFCVAMIKSKQKIKGTSVKVKRV